MVAINVVIYNIRFRKVVKNIAFSKFCLSLKYEDKVQKLLYLMVVGNNVNFCHEGSEIGKTGNVKMKKRNNENENLSMIKKYIICFIFKSQEPKYYFGMMGIHAHQTILDHHENILLIQMSISYLYKKDLKKTHYFRWLIFEDSVRHEIVKLGVKSFKFAFKLNSEQGYEKN